MDKLYGKIDKIHHDFQSQLKILDPDAAEYHRALRGLPKFKGEIQDISVGELNDIIDFIIFIRDDMGRHNTNFTTLISDTLDEIINIKKLMLIDLRETKNNWENCREHCSKKDNSKDENKSNLNPLGLIKSFKDIKIILITISILAVGTGVIVDSEGFITILKYLAKLFI